jgi:hypothetical protein
VSSSMPLSSMDSSSPLVARGREVDTMGNAVPAPLVAGTVVQVTFLGGLSSAEEVSDVFESADMLLVGGTTIVDKAGDLRLLDRPSRGEGGEEGVAWRWRWRTRP